MTPARDISSSPVKFTINSDIYLNLHTYKNSHLLKTNSIKAKMIQKSTRLFGVTEAKSIDRNYT